MRNMKFMSQLEKEGILLVDKPGGVSSHSVVNWARRVIGIKRIGHTGTLDPLATGLLILLVGRKYTKMQNIFLKQDKEYHCTGQLGLVTDTYDITGDIVEQTDWEELKKLTRAKVQAILPIFTGKIEQTVPIFSAVKVGGRKLYDYARKGEEKLITDLPIRKIEIKELELDDFIFDKKNCQIRFKLRVVCSSGTYIRSLIHDIGQEIGVGATVVLLRRTKIGEISLNKALLCPILF